MISPAPPLHPLARRSIVFTSLGVLHLLPVLGGLLGMRYGLRAVAAIRASGGAWRGEQAAFRSLFIGLLSAIVSTALLCLAIIVYQRLQPGRTSGATRRPSRSRNPARLRGRPHLRRPP
ncbi:MAG: hypothetical protein U1G05_12370 [Kiritimatiellia bacterium]